jgi:quercetin dioxygenase-like cupin family protein
MRTRLFVIFVLAALTLPAADTPIPVVGEPMHRTVFENGTLRVLDVQIPPGATSLFHTHVIPSVIVYLTASTNRSESWPDGAILTREILPGQSRYAAYDEKPLSHRVTNTGTGLFRVFDIELLRKPPAAGAFAPLSGVTAQWTEKLVRSSNLVLKPGAKLALPATLSAHFLVAIRGAARLTASSAKSETFTLKWGDYRFVPPQSGLELETSGPEPSEVVLLELR